MTQLPEPPRSIVAPGMYIFAGEVAGYTEPIIDPGNFRGEAVGLKMKVLEPINIPHSNYKNIEVFTFGHGVDCFPEAAGQTIPIGTRYWFAVYPSALVGRSSSLGNAVRLETRAFSKFGLDEEMFGYSINTESEFDYKNELRPLIEKFREPEMESKRGWLSGFLFIEASKDLLRLSKAKTEAERMRILERLLYCPDINYTRLFISEVGKPLAAEPRDEMFIRMRISQDYVYKGKPKKFSKRERELMKERHRLESSGELNVW